LQAFETSSLTITPTATALSVPSRSASAESESVRGAVGVDQVSCNSPISEFRYSAMSTESTESDV
jgi:hypothetical protein